MSPKAPAPSMVYQSDNLYEVRYDTAMKYISAQLVSTESVHLLRLIDGKPTYAVEYNMGHYNPHAVPLAVVDNAMADRIIAAFKDAGWTGCYWREFDESDPVLPLGSWGYRFYFERPIETIPYEVMRRIAKKETGDLPPVSEVSDAEARKEPQPVTVLELAGYINAQMPIRDQPRLLEGDPLAIIQSHEAKRYGYTGTGYYVGTAGELVVVLEMGQTQVYYCRRTHVVYQRNNVVNEPWRKVDTEIVLSPLALLSALKDLEVFNASVRP